MQELFMQVLNEKMGGTHPDFMEGLTEGMQDGRSSGKAIGMHHAYRLNRIFNDIAVGSHRAKTIFLNGYIKGYIHMRSNSVNPKSNCLQQQIHSKKNGCLRKSRHYNAGYTAGILLSFQESYLETYQEVIAENLKNSLDASPKSSRDKKVFRAGYDLGQKEATKDKYYCDLTCAEEGFKSAVLHPPYQCWSL